MPELERELRSLAAHVAWPSTPPFTLPFEEPRRRAIGDGRSSLRSLAVALALAVALSVPAARSAILRLFISAVSPSSGSTYCRPPRSSRSAPRSVPVVHAAAAQTALGAPVRLPKLEGPPGCICATASSRSSWRRRSRCS